MQLNQRTCHNLQSYLIYNDILCPYSTIYNIPLKIIIDVNDVMVERLWYNGHTIAKKALKIDLSQKILINLKKNFYQKIQTCLMMKCVYFLHIYFGVFTNCTPIESS